MKMKRLIIELCCAIALVACGNSQEPKAGEEDLRAKSLLQGIWIEDETELPLMRIEGDTIYYTDPRTYDKLLIIKIMTSNMLCKVRVKVGL